MRLVTIDAADGRGTVAAVALGERVLPLAGFADVGALLDGDGLERAAAVVAAASADDLAARVALSEAGLRCPVGGSGAVICVGLNYATHIREMGRELPTHPALFSKLPRALTDPFADVVVSEAIGQIDYEGELGVVIGRAGRDIPRERAWDHVGGLTVVNDITSRALQRRSPQWFAGKTLQASTPVGPAVVTVDDPEDLAERELRVTVNGEQRQRSRLGDLVFDVPTLVADISRIVELRPGDLIATGTPGGVGDADGRYLEDGDVVEVSITDIGTIRNRIRRHG